MSITEAIYIPGLLKLPEQTEVIKFNQFIADLESLTPVRGSLQVTHQGNYLDVAASSETIITLTCHRCLQQYNHRLKVDSAELIWLDELACQLENEPLEQEVALEDLVETLSPQGYFQPETWLYEQLCLALPPRQLCDQNCQGIPMNNLGTQSAKDRRWQALENLKRQLS